MSPELLLLLEQIALLAIRNAPVLASDIRMVIDAVKAGSALAPEQAAAISVRFATSYQDLMAAVKTRQLAEAHAG